MEAKHILDALRPFGRSMIREHPLHEDDAVQQADVWQWVECILRCGRDDPIDNNS